MSLRFRRSPQGSSPPEKLHDPPALAAAPRKLHAPRSNGADIKRVFRRHLGRCVECPKGFTGNFALICTLCPGFGGLWCICLVERGDCPR